MRQFQNILVCVDLSQGDKFVSDQLPPPTQEAIERSLWLAKLSGARITYVYALDISAATERMLEEAPEGEHSVIDDAENILGELAARARQSNVEADFRVRVGKSWVQIIREVMTGEHDLVVSGTRHLHGLQGFLTGSTGIKLLRKCPSAVWITQPSATQEIRAVLVAHCLREVGDLAMDLGCSMAELHHAQLHVVHALELPDFGHRLPGQDLVERAAAQREHAREHIESQLANYEFAEAPQIHIVTDAPDHAVLEHIESHAIELIVLGTLARSGVAGMITGNTAERLLPQIPCSILAVKPQGFVSPVSI